MTNWLYQYPAVVLRVIDGDTVLIKVNLGFYIYLEHSIRFFGVNAPELSTPEGKTAKAQLETLLPVGTNVMFQSHKGKPDKYGRLLGNLFLNGEIVKI